MKTARPLVLLGALLGLLVGVVAAVAIPRTHASPTTTATGASATPAPAQVLHVGPRETAGGDTVLRATSAARVEARARDPLGGPDWAVRVFAAERVVRPSSRRPGVNPVVGHPLCAQLGRIYKGTFGWLDARGTFRPMALEWAGTTSQCGSRLPNLNHQPAIRTLSPITDPDAPAAAVRSTLVWGLAGTAARAVTIKSDDKTLRRQRPSAHHAFLVVLPASVDQRALRVAVAYPDRTVTGPQAAPELPGLARPAGPTRIAARAPDPNGGLPFALIVRGSAEAGFCTLAGPRIVGDRAGFVDYRRDTLDQLRLEGGGACGGGQAEQDAVDQQGCLLGYSGGTGDLASEGGDPGGTGRTARRTQPGLTIVTARCSSAVASITLATPRDVRTLLPTGPTHAAMAVYDGSFPTGGIAWTARLRDGHVKKGQLRDAGF